MFPVVPSTPDRAPGRRVPTQESRPLVVRLATAFGVLTTAEVLLFVVGFLVQDLRLDRVVVVLAVLFLGAAAGSWMVLRGRRWGWLVLTAGAVGVLAALGMLALVLSALGVPSGLWVVAALAVGPGGCLALGPRREVREWVVLREGRRSAEGHRSARGRRSAARSR